jgi:hypothetical protein
LPPPPPIASRLFAAVWLAGFLWLALHGTTVLAPNNAGLWALAAGGHLWLLVF